jgi:alpha,alpha-trehalase
MVMRVFVRSIALLLVLVSVAPAQNPRARATDNAKVLTYIHGGWDTLSRSMSECKSVTDAKVTTTPILYLPAGMATPTAVKAMQQQCRVEVEHLPRTIAHMGDVKVAEIPKEGLLYLPNRYVVPGGRFNEMYGWDSYFIILGLVQDHRADLARGMVENFFFEIENYGAVLNANRTYFFTRSQPPLLTSMIRQVYEHSANQQGSQEWLAKAYGYAERDYQLWTHAPHLAGNTGLARYEDIGAGPVPEMADDSDYYSDVIRWLLAHPTAHPSYLVNAAANPTPAEAATLAKTSCDIGASKVCARAYVDGHRLSSDFYRGDRAMRESGFDTSFRFGPFSGSTDHYAPICLNSLLYKYEEDMAHFATLLGRKADADEWEKRAAIRHAAVDKYLWNAAAGLYEDYDVSTARQSSYNYITMLYPLWAGMASPDQAKRVEEHLSLFEHEGGLAMSGNDSGTQWDLPYGWAPTNWLAVSGLARYGYKDDAARVAQKFMATVRQNFLRDGTIREKYNVVSGSANVTVAAGYKSNVVGFGWTNGVYLMMDDLLKHGSTTQKQPN